MKANVPLADNSVGKVREKPTGVLMVSKERELKKIILAFSGCWDDQVGRLHRGPTIYAKLIIGQANRNFWLSENQWNIEKTFDEKNIHFSFQQDSELYK